MLGCGLGVDWSVIHQDNRVVLKDVVRYDGAGSTLATHFPDLTVEIPYLEYESQVLQFALEARQPFESQTKDTSDEDVPGEFAAFWKEFDNHLLEVADSNRDPAAG